MVELMVAALILAVAIGGLTGSIVAGLRLSRSNSETATAELALRAMVEEVQGTAFGDIFDDFVGTGFAVEGLDLQENDADGLAGRIVFPTLGGRLREDVVDAALGMPRDLNGDGDDVDDATDDYVILPLTVRVEWRGAAGPRFLERNLLLVD